MWAKELTEDQMAGVFWAAGEVVAQHAPVVAAGPALVSRARVRIALSAIRRAVMGRPLTRGELAEAIGDGSLEPLEAGEAHPMNMSEMKSALWAKRLAGDHLFGLLWAIGEVGMGVGMVEELLPTRVSATQVRAHVGLLALRSAVFGRPISVADLEEAFRLGDFTR